MAKIGSPLKITEPKRQDKTPVFAGGAGQINTTVPRGKLAMLDSGELQRAVTARAETHSELANMLVVGAQVYDNNEKLKKKQEQLKIEGDYKRWEISNQQEFYNVHTAKGKLEVYNSYQTGVNKLNAKVKGMGWDTLEDNTWAQGLAIGARQVGADFSTKHNHAQFTETFTDLKTKLAENEKDFANKGNIDPLTHRDIGIKTIEDMYALGAITKEGMIGKSRAYEHSIALKRGSLLATLWARKKRDDPANMPTREQLIGSLRQQVGLNITKDLEEPLHNVVVSAFLDEIKYGNKLSSYEEQLQAVEWKAERLAIDRAVKGAILDGSANGTTFKDAKDKYTLMGDTIKLLEMEELENAYYNNQQPKPKIVRHYTDPQGIGFQKFIAKGSPFMEGLMLNVEEAMSYLKRVPTGDEFDANDSATLLEVERKLHAWNDKIKNNEVDDARIYHTANRALLSYIQNSGQDQQGLAKRNALQNFLQIDANTMNQLGVNGQQLTNVAWGKLMYEKSQNYKSILDAISTDIDMEITRDREGVGLYSNEGFKKPTQVWSRNFDRDVEARLFKMLEITSGNKPVDLSSVASSDASDTLGQSTNSKAQNNFPTKAQKSTISTAQKVAKQNNTTVSAIQKDITSGNASGNSAANVINNAGSNIATAKSKKQPKTPWWNKPNNLGLTLNDFSEDEEPEIKPKTVADHQAILEEKTSQKKELFSNIFNKVQKSADESGERWDRIITGGVTAVRDFITDRIESQISQPIRDFPDYMAETLAEGYGLTGGYELKSGDKVRDEIIANKGDLGMGNIDFNTGKATRKPTTHAQLSSDKIQFIDSVSRKVAEEMETVSMTFTKSLPKHGTKLGVNIDKVLEQSTPAEKPKEQVFDPNVVPQIVRPIVEEVTKSIQTSLTPESIELPDRFEALDTTGKDKTTLDLEWLENWMKEKKREKARLAPLKEAKDMTKAQHKADATNEIDFTNEKKLRRWMELYNKNIDKKLTTKEKREFEKLIKYLQDREMIPQG